MRTSLIIVAWVVAINLAILSLDGWHTIDALLVGDALIWGYFSVTLIGAATLLVLALLVGLLGRWLGLSRTWRAILSGIVCGVIVTVGCIVMQKLDWGGVALSGVFLLAGSSVGFAVRARASQQLSHE